MSESVVRVEPLWSVHDVAAYLSVPVGTLYKWRGSQYGPPGFRIGKYLRYRRADVEAWLDSVTQVAA